MGRQDARGGLKRRCPLAALKRGNLPGAGRPCGGGTPAPAAACPGSARTRPCRPTDRCPCHRSLRVATTRGYACSTDRTRPAADRCVGIPPSHCISDSRDRRSSPRWRACRARARRIGASPDMCRDRSEEHTSELQSLMRISYAVFCLKKKTKKNTHEEVYYKEKRKD